MRPTAISWLLLALLPNFAAAEPLTTWDGRHNIERNAVTDR